MSIKLEKGIAALPSHKYNVETAGLSAGYSPSYAAGLLYRTISDLFKLSNNDNKT